MSYLKFFLTVVLCSAVATLIVISRPPTPLFSYTDTEIGHIVAEIKSGDLAPIADDALIDAAEHRKLSDVYTAVDHASGQRWLNRILVALITTPTARDDPHRFTLFLYDDRHIPEPQQNIFSQQSRIPASLPGGTVYLGIQYVLAAHTEADIAGVLAHEMAHALLRHYAKQRLHIRNVARLQEQAVCRSNAQCISRLKVAVQILRAEIAEAFENEADQLGQKILREAGYDDAAVTHMLSLTFANEPRRIRAKIESLAHAKPGLQLKQYGVGTRAQFHAMQKALQAHLIQIDQTAGVKTDP